ncbi:MAG: hypothetical protein NT038_05165 [Euryarchaeota archaeon]|nr:hypothetical protein [Euryarchaeota archaeon]
MIKFDSAENKKEEKPQEAPSKKHEPGTKKPSDVKLDNLTDAIDIPETKAGTATAPTSSREDLEMKRTILQNMKDFDFQIKKNQEDVTKVTEKLDGLSKDLDDLVSLYEIVSEQMNPFVGLSKVTKKRIEALETFTKDIDELKTRMGDLEGTGEKKGISIKPTGTAENLPDADKKTNDQEKPNEPKPSEETSMIGKENLLPTKTGAEALAKELLAKKSTELQVKTEVSMEKPAAKTDELKSPEQTQMISGFNVNGLSADVLDEILNTALTNLLYEQKMDTLIDEFIMSLNG